MRLAVDRRDEREAEIDARSYAAAGHAIAVEHHSLPDRDRAEVGEMVMLRPMAGGAIPSQQPRRAEQQRTGADAGDPLGTVRRAAHPGHRRLVLDRVVDA